MRMSLVLIAAAIAGCAGDSSPPNVETSPDASAPVTPAGRVIAPPVNECGSATLEVGAGGVFRGTTCGCSDTRGACSADQPSGRPEARFQMTVPPGQWSCKVTVSEGLTYMISGEGVPDACGIDTGYTDLSLPVEELPGIIFGGGETGRVYRISIETFDTACGEYEMHVHCGVDLI